MEPASRSDKFSKGENTMRLTAQTPFRLLALVFFALIALVLVGCGEGSKSPAFVDPDPEPVANLRTGVPDRDPVEIDAGASTAIAIQLDRAPPKAVTVGLSALDFDDAFEVPAAVTVGANQAIAIFEVKAKAGAAPGEQAEFQIIPGERYQVGMSDPVRLIIASIASESITLVGVNQTIDSGSSAMYSLQRSDTSNEVTLELELTGDVDAFEVTPTEVTFPEGFADASFTVLATGSTGQMTVSFLPPEGYVLGDIPSVTITITGP